MQLPVSPYDKFCVGYENSGVEGNGYLMGLVIGVGKTKMELSHEGSHVLDSTNAFDRAEVEDTNLGQINMITVSSFCGPQGKIWGLDLAFADKLRKDKLFSVAKVPVYSANPLLKASRSLFGTVKTPRFKLLPGSHVPCASKNIAIRGPATLYAAIGIGVCQDRGKDACLMMEDVGEKGGLTKIEILERLAKSILEVSANQGVKYKEIFTSLKEIVVEEDEMGCALVAAPYFALAKNAVPVERKNDLRKISITAWEKMF